MINSFLNHTNTPENQTKISNFKGIRQSDRRFNNGNNDNHYLRSNRQKDNFNNHRFYSNKEYDNKVNNLSEVYAKINRLDLYNSNSKPKIDEKKSNNLRLNFKDNNNNYNIYNINNAYHSLDKNQKKGINNTNLKLLESDIYTPRINNKSKNYVDSKNPIDLAKTSNNFKRRDNYGYHEIKDVKKNNIMKITNITNTDKKNSNKNISNYFSVNISNNNSFKYPLKVNINNNPNNTNINNRNFISNDSNQKNEQNNNINDVNNDNKKLNYDNFKTVQNFNPQKKVIIEENNYSSYKNIKDNQNKNDNTKTDVKQNLNESLLIRKIYIKNNEEKKQQNENNTHFNYIKRNDIKDFNTYFNDKENNKNSNINSNKYLAGDVKDVVKSVEKEKNIHKINIDDIKLNQPSFININKDYSSIKIDNKDLNHNKQKSYLNYNTNSTEKKVPKKKEQYEINHIFKKIEKKNIINNFQSSRNNKNDRKNDDKKSNINVINKKIIKVNSKDKDNSSMLLNNNQSLTKVKNNINNKNDQIQKTDLKNINKKYIKNDDNKYNKYKVNKNNLKLMQKISVRNNNKTNTKYVNPFISEANNPRKDLTNEKKKYKNIINKKCKSIEKNDRNKDKEIKNPIDEVNRARTNTKSKAKKHSKQVKYLDKLKIFKYPEINYNIFYESTTNYSKENNDYKYKKYALRSNKSHSKKKKDINSFNLNYKTFEEDFKINQNNIDEKYQNLKPQISVRITLSKKNNVNIAGILRYFKVNYFCSENLRNKCDIDSEDTSEYYNSKF